MRVAILYNEKPAQAATDVPEDEYEEYDSEETISAIAAALAASGVSATPVVATRDMPAQLDGRFDFVFNIAEGAGRRCREAVPAAVCELLGLPYTGSDALTLAVTLDKAMARRIVSPDIPVARAATCESELGSLRFPVVVKPNDEGSSKGIRTHSLCESAKEAEAQMRWLGETYHCPVLVEEYLPGPEVTVCIAGNGPGTRIIGMMEIAPANGSPGAFLYSLEIKRDWRNRVQYHIPPRLSHPVLTQLSHFALLAHRLLGCRDIARMDFRLNENGQPCFLECNPLPGLNPESSDLVIATRGEMSYPQLIRGILHDAAARYGIAV